jgi:hypothetical protein
MVISRVEDNFPSLRVNEMVAIDAAYRTVAVENLEIRERRRMYGVGHSAAVAVRFVRSKV